MLRPTEAAVVARVALRDVNEPSTSESCPMVSSRSRTAGMCWSLLRLISFYFASARHLTSEERLFAVREAGSRLRQIQDPGSGGAYRGRLDGSGRIPDH